MQGVFILSVLMLSVFVQCAVANDLMLCIIILGLITLCNDWVVIMLTSSYNQFCAGSYS
jgi:hypothetical protein